MSLLLQGIGHFLRHVVFIMLGEHVVGAEHAAPIKRAFRHDTLPFPEQVRQDALIGNRNGLVPVRQVEANAISKLKGMMAP